MAQTDDYGRVYADPTPWPEALRVLERAELYWLTTLRRDGRPHVTPLIGVADEAAVHFCTGLREQKARNLEDNGQVALTTGNNRWARGLDVVIEGALATALLPSPASASRLHRAPAEESAASRDERQRDGRVARARSRMVRRP